LNNPNIKLYKQKVDKNYMERKLETLVIGAGERGRAFARYIQDSDLGIHIVGVADPIEERRNIMSKEYSIKKEGIFETGEDALKEKGKYDFVYIATPDRTHYNLAKMALKKGYNVLLEKPMATTPEECIGIINEQRKSGKNLAICHVLRYSPFFQKIKSEISSRRLGKVKTIDIVEKTAYWHFPHSFVRGNWAKSEESGPTILTKSCHDLDIISWLSEDDPDYVFSQGGINFFKRENAPENSAERCVDCSIEDCVFDAKKVYLDHEEQRFPHNAISIEDQSEEGRKKAIETGPYGRCAWKCDNDVSDTQNVIISFKKGIQATFSLRWGGDEMTRKINIQLEKGEISGDLYSGQLLKTIYSGRRGENAVEDIGTKMLGSHGGGDPILIQGFNPKFNNLPRKTPTTIISSEIITFRNISLKSPLVIELRFENKSPMAILFF